MGRHIPLRGRDGTYRWFLSRAPPIRDDDGKVVRWFGTNTDITEQLEAEKALRELNETLEHRVEAELTSVCISGMSREICCPSSAATENSSASTPPGPRRSAGRNRS